MAANTRLRTVVVLCATLGVVLSVAAPADAAPPKRTPGPSVAVSPVSPTNQRTATWTFSDLNTAAKFACSFDGSAYAACTSPVVRTGLTAGNHTLSVRATVPNWRPATASASLVVDLTPPAAPSVLGMPSGPTRSAITPSFSDSSTDVVGYRCSVDAAPEAACTGGASLDAAADGLRSLSVRAVDKAGNLGAATTVTWVRDTFVATPFVTSGPSSTTIDTAAIFHYATHETGAVFQCSLDTAAFVSCPSTGVTYSGLTASAAPGTAHTFVVRATDTVGNVAASSVFTWRVESPAPGLVAASWSDPAGLPSGVTNQSSAAFAFQTTNSTGVLCQVDGAAAAACTSPLQVSGLGDGQHAVVVTASGASGSVALSYTWLVDVTPPPAPHIYGPPSRSAATSVSAWVVPALLDDVVTCQLDGAATPCTLSAPLSAAGLADGPHTIMATETDRAGNTTTSSATWTVDTVAPTYVVSTPTSTSGAATVTFSEDATAASLSPVLSLAGGGSVATTRTCTTAGGIATACDGPSVRTVAVRAARALVPGQYYALTVNGAGVAPVTDVAGNPAATGTTSFRAPTAVQENDAATVQSWRRVSSSTAKGGSYVLDSSAGARARWSFTGTSFVTYLATGPSFGLATVYVDGRAKGTWNTYAARAGYAAKLVYGLSAGPHTVIIQVSGKRGSRLGTGTWVGIDGFKVGATVVKTPVLTTTWRRASYTGSSGGAHAVSSAAGSSFALAFRGTSVSWRHATGPAMGLAYVYVDGVRKATVDLWSATARAGVTWRLASLTDAQHTIRIVPTGTKRAASKGTLVSVDRISTV